MMACNVFTFIDNEQVMGPSEELTWPASHELASKQSYLGIQDASRKERPCSQMAGAWAGAIVQVLDQLGMCVLTPQEIWVKMRGILEKWKVALRENDPKLSHKELLADQGFLMYVTRTYLAMVPFLKGFPLTIEMWRGGQDSKGWKLREIDDSSVSSHQSLESLDRTRAGAHGLDLDKVATYVPASRVDEDEAAVDYWLGAKPGQAMSMQLWMGFSPLPPVSRMTLMLYST